MESIIQENGDKPSNMTIKKSGEKKMEKTGKSTKNKMLKSYLGQ